MACRLETPAVKIEMSVKASLKIFVRVIYNVGVEIVVIRIGLR